MEADAKKRLASKIGSRIARARLDAGLTQDEVAERLGIGNQAVSRMERGVAMPTLERLYEFAGLFNCRVDSFLLEASPREADIGASIAQKLSGLPLADREFLSTIVSLLGDHLRKRKRKGKH
ncbi:MAG: XRE family transcriptional regulator [Burkholderiales bacterium]|uniref:helix-turn-helix domain-containing protein n=1 Tax=Roseateles sp. TaxID=1971397 RepID=UPI000FBD8928|nr:MAG: XRE family transcriptional regulator [Burkholderiales bacterium]